jgi:hypothetical protein
MSRHIRDKLRNRHKVSDKELAECFENRTGTFLFDQRAEHLTNPRTRWFLARTTHQRLLKVVFIPAASGKGVTIKTAYEPNQEEVRIYRKYGCQ